MADVKKEFIESGRAGQPHSRSFRFDRINMDMMEEFYARMKKDLSILSISP